MQPLFRTAEIKIVEEKKLFHITAEANKEETRQSSQANMSNTEAAEQKSQDEGAEKLLTSYTQQYIKASRYEYF